MVWDQDGPLILRQTPHPLTDAAGFIDVAFTTAFTISVGACIDWVAQHGVDGNVGGLDPEDLAVGPFVGKAQPLALKPKPRLAGRTQFGKLFKYRADRAGDGLIGMKDHLALALAPEQPDGQTTAQFSTLGFVENGAIEAHPQDVQFRFGAWRL
jgi:hypothetical protein